MIEYILTALAGLAIGIVAMRVWQARESAQGAADAPEASEAPAEAEAEKAEGAGMTGKLLLGAAALGILGVLIFLFRPSPEEAAGGALPAAVQTSGLADVDTMIDRLKERLEQNPDGEGYRMLGWSYVMTNRPADAIEPYEKALELLPDNAAVHAGYGEALVGVADGTVTGEAKGHFDTASKLDPAEPRTRYFLAMWDAQHGRERQALDAWIELANSEAGDAPWQADLRNQIDTTAAKLGVDVSGRLAAAAPVPPAGEPPELTAEQMQQAQALPADQQQAMVDDMVEGLARKLKANPQDADGWARLLRSRMVLGQTEQAAEDLKSARTAFAGDPEGLKAVNAAARQNGVPGA